MKRILLLLFAIPFLSLPAAAQLPNFSKTDCKGVTHDLYEDLAAGKAVVLKFCAVWCGPCAYSNGPYQKAWEDIGEGNCNVKMYTMLFEGPQHGVSTNCTEGTAYASKYGLTMPVITDIGTWLTGLTGQFAKLYTIDAIPTTLIILPNQQDPASSTVEKIVGAATDLDQKIKDKLGKAGWYAPKFTMTGNFCSSPPFSATLTSAVPTGNLWSTGETAQSITVTENGTYSLNVNLKGCTYAQSETIEFKQTPAVGTISTPRATLCENSVILLNYALPEGSSSNAMWYMYLPASDQPIDIAPVTDPQIAFKLYSFNLPAGTVVEFGVRASHSTGGCDAYSNRVSVTITSGNPTTTPGTASASATRVCAGSDFTLHYSGGAPESYWEIYNDEYDEWIVFADADKPVNPNGLATLKGAGGSDRFRVLTTTGTCFTVSNEVQVNYYTHSVQITGPSVYCGNAALTLQVNSNLSDITWSTGASTSSIQVNPTVQTVYTVTARDGNGCNYTDQHTVDIWKKVEPVIQVTTGGSVCPGNPVTLSFTGTKSAPPCTSNVYGQYPDEAYTLTQCNGTSEQITEWGYLGEYSLVNIVAGNYYKFISSGLSEGDIINTVTSADGLTTYASGKFSTIWKASYTGQARFYTHGTGCAESNLVEIIRSVACFANSAALGTYLWMPGGQTTPSITVSPAQTTAYTLTFTEAGAPCAGSASKQFIVGIGSVELSTTHITKNSAQFNWTSSVNPVQWQIRYKTTNLGSKWKEVNIPGNQRSYLVSSLTDKQAYIWQLRAICGKNWTDYSTALEFTTGSSQNLSAVRMPQVEVPILVPDNRFSVTAMPNPSSSHFTVTVQGIQQGESATMVVTDVLGRIVEKRILFGEQTVKIGGQYKSGAYMIRMWRGKEIRQLKLVKLP